ncbi:hypothetical protein DFH07DRAFT_925504 [Mycena maculata]|uniref:F-box domain-containing protein n=1 Tax=Mycena maculata TaxID=230809 RepID=A0AAD7IGN7_9AGAR|nr:hypothetical protein DFH07DRAFT_925504 [Mycena maculata]
MSATRRQSGRLAAQVVKATDTAVAPEIPRPAAAPSKKRISAAASGKVKVRSKPASEDEPFEDSEQESGVESDASEYGKKPPKRPRLTKATTATRKRKAPADTTCYLTTIPLDVLLEIYGHLGPKDLILLSRTNHAFRQHLLSTAANSVWKKSRQSMDGPDCPEDLSEQRWAHLLYGEAKCQTCGAKNVQRVDFGLRRRACTRCLKANLVVKSSFKKHFPHLDDTMLALIPHTNIGGFAHGHASNSNFYWKHDIEQMAELLAVYERDINMRIIGARQKLEDFTAERTALVSAVEEHAQLCGDWSNLLAARRREEEALKVKRRFAAIEAKFIDLGYTAADVSCIAYKVNVRQGGPLTDRIWNRIFPELEPSVKEQKAHRLKREHEARVDARKRLAEGIFNEYKKTLVPAQWRYLPGLFEVLQFPAFKALVDAPDDVDVEIAHFNEVADSLPGFVVSWTATRKTELAQLVDNAFAPEPAGTEEVQVSPRTAPNLESLDRVTTVFRCQQFDCGTRGGHHSQRNPCLVGWEAAAAHHCCEIKYTWGAAPITSVKTVLKFSMPGSMAAASLVSLTGLDVQRATCMEMDALDLRFLCAACIPRNGPNNNLVHTVFSWRAAVSHFAASGHSTPSWRLLTGAEALPIKASELPDPIPSWSCNHCPQYLDACNTFANVADHVKSTHAIANPTAPADLFRYLDLARSPATFLTPRPVVIKPAKTQVKTQQPSGAQYHCLRCSSLGGAASRRLFIFGGVQAHLRDKHKILNPVCNQDWKQVP